MSPTGCRSTNLSPTASLTSVSTTQRPTPGRSLSLNATMNKNPARKTARARLRAGSIIEMPATYHHYSGSESPPPLSINSYPNVNDYRDSPGLIAMNGSGQSAFHSQGNLNGYTYHIQSPTTYPDTPGGYRLDSPGFVGSDGSSPHTTPAWMSLPSPAAQYHVSPHNGMRYPVLEPLIHQFCKLA